MRQRVIGWGIAALVLAGFVGSIVRGGGGVSGGGAGGGSDSHQAPAPAAAPAASAGGAGEAELAVAGPRSPAIATTGTVRLVQPRIVKTARLSLRVSDGSFAERFQQASLIAARHGGFVSSSDTSRDRLRAGTLLLRVPAARFERALGDLKALGRVTAEAVSGEDVTAQFVDLEARLRHWEAQESVLLRLMSKAKTVDASIKVQRRLQDVQLAIEEIRGQLRVLSDQTEMSSISVSISEAGVVPRSSEGVLSKAWRQALSGFLSVFAAVIVGLGYVIPLGLIALLGVAVWLVFRRVRARVA